MGTASRSFKLPCGPAFGKLMTSVDYFRILWAILLVKFKGYLRDHLTGHLAGHLEYLFGGFLVVCFGIILNVPLQVTLWDSNCGSLCYLSLITYHSSLIPYHLPLMGNHVGHPYIDTVFAIYTIDNCDSLNTLNTILDSLFYLSICLDTPS